MNLYYSSKEFDCQRGTEKWSLTTGHEGSNVGFILYGEHCSMFEAERILQNWGVDNIEEGTCAIDVNRSWSSAYANIFAERPQGLE